jgi:hypothetical protein
MQDEGRGAHRCPKKQITGEEPEDKRAVGKNIQAVLSAKKRGLIHKAKSRDN